MSVQACPRPEPSGELVAARPARPDRAASGWSPRATRALLAGVVALALGLRLWALDFQLPYQLHPDEGHYVWKAVDMVRDGNLNPKYFRNPSLYTYLLFGQFKLLELFGVAADGSSAGPGPLEPPSLYALLGRLTSALLGAATVVVAYRLGALLLVRAAGLLGGLLLAVAFLHVRDSHFATNDAPATFLLMLSVLASALYARSGRARDVVLAGLFGGLATSAKYNAGFFIVPLLLAHGFARGRAVVRLRALIDLVGSGLVAGLAYLAGTPFTLLAWPTFLADFRVQQRFSRDGWEGQGPEPVGWLYLDAFGNGVGWVALALAAAGLLLLARRRPKAAALLAAYPLVYLAYMLGVRLFFVRFAITMVPFVCLLAGYGAWALARRLPRPETRGPALAALVALAVAQPLWSSLRHDQILDQPDTRVLAAEWLEANLPSGAKVVADDYSVRDRRPRAFRPDGERFDLDVVNSLGEQDLDAYRRRGYDYAVSSSFQSARFAGRLDTYGRLERETRPLVVFAPTASGAELPFDIEALYSPFHDLGRSARPGPTVRIYALR